MAYVAKGILKNGMNLTTSDYIFALGGENQLSLEKVETFALKLSQHLGKEISGSYFGGKETTHVTIGMYEGNEHNKSRHLPGLSLGYERQLTLIGSFHTHFKSDVPSERDKENKKNDFNKNPYQKINYYIISPPGNNGENISKKEYTDDY